ncbi:mitochondrial ribosomal protein l51 / s25 / CI-B8 domain-containing protein [Ditylenchus destructor]|uniref:Small ribosomal subunit protein mS25 n=1 Tax=Ditylenchus destructor TaxID=166010 RepID=A0AAD4R3R8_9BILA|nr:mitochondrial ribosomal protein l51 / s25 / CI-B8 domain-containing protein [Ditylenchus destructor]
MPFMRGAMPLKRTLYYLQQGKIVFRDDVAICVIGYHRFPTKPELIGASEFVYWHYNQIQHKNPDVQLLKRENMSQVPYAMAILKDGREVVIDLDGKSKDECIEAIQSILGKTKLVQQYDMMKKSLKSNVVQFGAECQRQCICEVQGQRPCTNLLEAPDFMKARWSAILRR